MGNFKYYNVIGLIDEAKALGGLLMTVADVHFDELRANNGTSDAIVDDLTGLVSGIAGGLTTLYPLSDDEQESVQQGWTTRYIDYYKNRM